MFPNSREDLKRYCVERGCGSSPTFGQKVVTLFVSPALWAIFHHRFGFWVNSIETSYKNPVKLSLKIIYFLGCYLLVCFTKIEILATVDIGPGLFLSNGGNIILGARKLGAGCTFQHNVTIGQGVSSKELPTFGDNISVGHDSLVFGNITIGDNVVIGDNTVLSRSVPSGIIIQGQPCKIVRPGGAVS